MIISISVLTLLDWAIYIFLVNMMAMVVLNSLGPECILGLQSNHYLTCGLTSMLVHDTSLDHHESKIHYIYYIKVLFCSEWIFGRRDIFDNSWEKEAGWSLDECFKRKVRTFKYCILDGILPRIKYSAN